MPKLVPPSPSRQISPVTEFFAPHPTSLERAVTPQQGIGYPAKLRLSLENISGQTIRLLPLSWLTSEFNISVQCGAAPYQGIAYREEMMEFCLQYQLEEHAGSWKSEKWKKKASGATR